MMMVSNELEKLILYVGEKKRITLGDVETMVLAAKQRSLYELTDAISAKDRVRALEMLDAILTTGDGEDAAIGHLYMLAKTFRQMLVILERNVRDQRMLWAALWQGFRVPPFAADDIIQASPALQIEARTDAGDSAGRQDGSWHLRSNPASKRLVLEKLVLDLTAEPKPEVPGWIAGRVAGLSSRLAVSALASPRLHRLTASVDSDRTPCSTSAYLNADCLHGPRHSHQRHPYVALHRAHLLHRPL